jgi:hypothetical protein
LLVWEYAMRSKSDFWLTLHRLTQDLEREGATPRERATSVCEVLDAVPADARVLYLSNLQSVLTTLVEVQEQCKKVAQP